MDTTDRNEVTVEGRVSGEPDRRVLPSGDEVVVLRLVVRRGDGVVDTLPVSIGPAPAKGRRPRAGQVGRRLVADAARLPVDARVRVRGALRRRWWQAGTVRHSRIEIAASGVEVLEPSDR